MQPDAAQVNDGQGHAHAVSMNRAAKIEPSAVPNTLAVELEIDFGCGCVINKSADDYPQNAFIEVVIHEVDLAGNRSHTDRIEPHFKSSRLADVEKSASKVTHQA